MKPKMKSSVRKKPSKYAEIELKKDESDGDEEMTVPAVDSEEEEEMPGDFGKYQASLRSALRAGDGKKKPFSTEVRTEAAKVSSEFAFTKGSQEGKKSLSMESMIKSLKKSSKGKNFEQVKKKLKDVPNSKKEIKTLEIPAEKIVSSKVARTVLYDNVKKEVSKWNSIVYHNRVADQLVFPLNAGKKVPKITAKDALADFVPQNPLEEEMARLLHGEEYVKRKKEEMQAKDTATVDAENYTLNVEEALAEHSEMARLRALQSYEMAKAKRKNKIKSKQYHRLLRREKIKKQLKEFEELQQKDPEAAMEKLNELEVSRIKERMSLKHRNTSKWAKMQAARAKYNKESRMALGEQLKISRDLTQKIEESSDEDEEDLALPSLVKSSLDNPWMLSAGMKDNEKVQLYFTGYRKMWEDVNARKEKERLRQEKEKQEEEERKKPPVVLAVLDTKSATPKKAKIKTAIKQKEKSCKKVKKEKLKLISPSKSNAEENEDNDEHMTEDQVEVLLNNAEKQLKASVTKKLKELNKNSKKNVKKLNRKAELKKQSRFSKRGDVDEIQDLNVDEDAANIELVNEAEMSADNSLSFRKQIPKPDDKTKQIAVKPTSIDPKNFLKISKGAKFVKFDGSLLNSADLDDDDEDSDGDDQRKLIAEAFEDDDVVIDFQKKKREIIEEAMPKDINLTLPGWGEWGGKDIQPSFRKRKRFQTKAKPLPPRKDAKMSHVILNENAVTKLKEHQVKQLPFPFTRVKDFEKIIRAPVGRTWMPEKSMKTLTAPKVITRLGAVIKPISEDLLVKTKHSKDAKKLSAPSSILQLTKKK